jgi:hypothetical protein
MSDQTDQGRKAWVRGDAPQDPKDKFAQHASRGRQELGTTEEADELLNELDDMLAERYGSGADAGAKGGDKQGESAKIRRLPRLYAIAATFLLLLAAGWWWSQQAQVFDAEAVYAAAFEPYANDLGGRSMGGDEPDSLALGRTLAAAVLAYDRRDFSAAADSFALYRSTAPATAPNATAAALYHGISLLAANRPTEAQAALLSLREDSTYGDPANWYLALALLRSGDTTEAKSVLRTIANNNSSPFRAAAQKLLPDIP